MALALNTEIIINLNLIAEPPAEILKDIKPMPAGFCHVKWETRARGIAMILHNAAPMMYYAIGERFCNYAVTPDGFAKIRFNAMWQPHAGEQERFPIVIGTATEAEVISGAVPDAHALLRRCDRMLVTLINNAPEPLFCIQEEYWRGTNWEALPTLTLKQFKAFVKKIFTRVLTITARNTDDELMFQRIVTLGDDAWLKDIQLGGEPVHP